MINKLIFIYLIFSITVLSQKRILIFEIDCSSNYNTYIVNDLVRKNIFLYSDFNLAETYKKRHNYKKIKSNIKKLTLDNNADFTITYNVYNYKDGLILNYVIFNKEKPNEWVEKNIYSKEYTFFESINKMLENIYGYSTNKIVPIEENEYISLLGYYSQKVNNIINNAEDDKNLYYMFFNFYKDNIYFNMDYLNYLMEKGDKTALNDIKIITDNMSKSLEKNNHYYLSAIGDLYYSKYKVNVIADDIDLSIKNYLDAIDEKNNYYIYYQKLARAYVLNNDYKNASKYYEASINIYDKDIDLLKEAVYLLKNDTNNNGNKVINYLKKIIDINVNDYEALEELADIYNNLGDYDNAKIYYNKLLDALNYHLYIINNEKQNPTLYDIYAKKRNNIKIKIEKFN